MGSTAGRGEPARQRGPGAPGGAGRGRHHVDRRQRGLALPTCAANLCADVGGILRVRANYCRYKEQPHQLLLDRHPARRAAAPSRPDGGCGASTTCGAAFCPITRAPSAPTGLLGPRGCGEVAAAAAGAAAAGAGARWGPGAAVCGACAADVLSRRATAGAGPRLARERQLLRSLPCRIGRSAAPAPAAAADATSARWVVCDR